MTTRKWARCASLLILAVTAACDSSPKGPGELSGSIEGPTPLGAATLEVRGEGIVGFEGAGTTHVFSQATETGMHRVVLIGEVPGDLTFRVKVQEMRDPPPIATLTTAADGANVPVTSVQAFQVHIVR